MGYHTDFEGRFDCCRVENEKVRAFLRAIREGDDVALAAMADWLTEQGDARGERIAELAGRVSRDMAEFWAMFGLRPEHAAYLTQFSDTRRMRRDTKALEQFTDPVREAVGLPVGSEGAYFVGGGGHGGQDHDSSVLEYNRPPSGQPGLWCKWAPNESGTAIVWNEAEKFYDYVKWLKYLIEHFLRPWGYVLNGEVRWAGEEEADRGVIRVKDNEVTVLED